MSADAEYVFGVVRFSVPAEWSDWAVDKLVARLVADEPDERVMPRGLTYDERRQFHVDQ